MKANRTALICGVSGQDGAYLAQFLIEKGYRVIGASRDSQVNPFNNLRALNVLEQVERISMDLRDFRSVAQAVSQFEPDEIYNLSGQSSVALSFEQPMETMESISAGTLNLLESIRFFGSPTRLYNAGSGECFGDTGNDSANELTPFRPRSPYAMAKATAHWACAIYRDAYSLFACSGLLFNHESPLRPARFVTRKIVKAAVSISNGSRERLRLGNLNIRRDWGWAPEYVRAMWQILQLSEPDDFVIATGRNDSLKDFLQTAFELRGLDWEDWVDVEEDLKRPSDISANRGDPSRAATKIGWKPHYFMPDVVRLMVEAESS